MKLRTFAGVVITTFVIIGVVLNFLLPLVPVESRYVTASWSMIAGAVLAIAGVIVLYEEPPKR